MIFIEYSGGGGSGPVVRIGDVTGNVDLTLEGLHKKCANKTSFLSSPWQKVKSDKWFSPYQNIKISQPID